MSSKYKMPSHVVTPSLHTQPLSLRGPPLSLACPKHSLAPACSSTYIHSILMPKQAHSCSLNDSTPPAKKTRSSTNNSHGSTPEILDLTSASPRSTPGYEMPTQTQTWKTQTQDSWVTGYPWVTHGLLGCLGLGNPPLFCTVQTHLYLLITSCNVQQTYLMCYRGVEGESE